LDIILQEYLIREQSSQMSWLMHANSLVMLFFTIIFYHYFAGKNWNYNNNNK
jgi:hypothetical protein